MQTTNSAYNSIKNNTDGVKQYLNFLQGNIGTQIEIAKKNINQSFFGKYSLSQLYACKLFPLIF